MAQLGDDAVIAQYRGRSVFYHRMAAVVERWDASIARLGPRRWNPAELGISPAAWSLVSNSGIEPQRVFCHPDVIARDPALIAYYRCVAAVPQKGARRLWAAYRPTYERPSCHELPAEVAKALANQVNQHISELLLACYHPDELTAARLFAAAAMNFGAQVNGSWRNLIGTEGARKAIDLIVAFLEDREAEPTDDGNAYVLPNGYRVAFGSEPDVAIYGPSGEIVAAIEIKSGLDPAGALERYGAAKKSFDAALSKNKAVDTVYVAAVVTPAVRAQIEHDRLVRHDFDLAAILQGTEEADRFFEHLRRLLDLPKR